MNLYLSVAAFALMVVGNYWVARSVLYPPFIFCAMWLLDLVVLSLHLIEADPVHSGTLTLICVGGAVFSAGGALASTVPKKLFEITLKLTPQVKTKKHFKVLLLSAMVCCVPHVILATMRLASAGAGSGFFERARNAAIDAAFTGRGQPDLITLYFGILSIYLAVLFMIDNRDWIFWSAALMALLANALGGGRTNLLTLIGSLTTVYIVQAGREHFLAAFKAARLPVLLFLSLYIGLIFVNKDTSNLGNVGDVIKYFVVSYLIGPTVAFDHVFQRPSDYMTTANHSFHFFFTSAAALHLINYTSPVLFDDFVFVPFPTNVYTVYKWYFLECGIVGVVLILGVFGFVHSMLYRIARSSDLGLFLFSISVYSVVMVIFDDAYVLGNFLRSVIVGLLLLWMRGFDVKLLPTGKRSRQPVALS